jgi:hypothetical protein
MHAGPRDPEGKGGSDAPDEEHEQKGYRTGWKSRASAGVRVNDS